MEIERKWVLRSLPPVLLSEIPDLEIFQAYLPLLGYQGEARIRALTQPRNGETTWQLTFKTLGSLVREEWEIPIPEWLFATLKETAKKQLLKTVSFIRYSEFKLEFHVYTERFLKGLIVMECEFKSELAAQNFQPPDWLDIIKEITDDPHYRNSNLAANGLPK